ncbi:MAG TPA: hypothetical protein PKC03_15990, partial [Dokdonella sp.]|nr:hypothetical protein [Dokdonella sp.]
GVRIGASDGCAHTKALQYAVYVDATPPVVEITSPQPTELISIGVVEISGTTDDPLFASWTLDVASSTTSGSWDRLAQGSDASSMPRVLAQWQRGNAVGPARIRLRASDVLGNTSEATVEVEFAGTARLIEFASIQPLLFSPNADQVLDTSRVTVGLLASTQITLDVGGRVLFDGVAPGTLTIDWDGRNAGGATVADGAYVATIHAADPQGVRPPETVLLSVTVDNTAPAIDFLQPAGAHANAESGVRVRINDMHLVEYRISL